MWTKYKMTELTYIHIYIYKLQKSHESLHACGSVCLSARVCVYLQEYARMRPKIISLSSYTFLQKYGERIILLVVLSL